MRLQRAKPWNAVIATTRDIAEQYIDAFGLSHEMWEARGLGERKPGERFHRIVIVRPHWHISGAEYSEFQTKAETWVAAVDVDGYFKII